MVTVGIYAPMTSITGPFSAYGFGNMTPQSLNTVEYKQNKTANFF